MFLNFQLKLFNASVTMQLNHTETILKDQKLVKFHLVRNKNFILSLKLQRTTNVNKASKKKDLFGASIMIPLCWINIRQHQSYIFLEENKV